MGQATAPAIAPLFGRRYRLRNGQTVVLWGQHKEGFLVGDYRPPVAEQRYTCQPDGWYAPESGVRPHELDVVEAVTNGDAAA